MKKFLVAITLSVWLTLAVAADAPRYSLEQQGAVLFMSILGGLAGWYAKVRKGDVSAASLFALIGEMTTSCFAGLGAYFACGWLHVDSDLTAAICGLCGYMGGRAIETAERVLQARIDKVSKL